LVVCVLRKTEATTGTRFAFSGTILNDLASLVLQASGENEKLRTNCVRCSGDLIRSFDPLVKNELLEALVHFIAESISSDVAKIKWNACHAAGNAFHNRELLQHPGWVKVFEKLVAALSENPLNFKVRINAVTSLMIPPQREDYLGTLLVVFQAVRAGS
jgi:hypothetical protein